MQTKYLYVLLGSCLFLGGIRAQEKKFEAEVLALTENMEAIAREERSILVEKVDQINENLEKGQFSYEEAQLKKREAADLHAKNMEQRIQNEKKRLDALVKDKVTAALAQSTAVEVDSTEVKAETLALPSTKIKILDIERSTKRTASQTVFAMGVNNVLTQGALGNSDFRYWGSHFYEWGWSYTTRLRKDDNLLHIKYGVSMMYNNLRATDNRYFVKNEEETLLEQHDKNLRDSRFRNLNLVVPIHLEFDFSPTVLSEDGSKKIFSAYRKLRIGVGGYVGANVKTKQIVKYKEDGRTHKVKDKGDYATNDLVYGLSAYIGYRSLSLYSKYDLSPLFKNNEIKQNNISLGMRIDLY
ncbi:hypothetical protein [Flavobacterium sp. JP2137]|uniref:hypothetical protein n=1 Tax=Flavobacterium sp. JP2137 TaxID=3414510 RepID=UPI003D2FF002